MMLKDIVTSIVKVLCQLAVLTFYMRISSKINTVCNYAALESTCENLLVYLLALIAVGDTSQSCLRRN